MSKATAFQSVAIPLPLKAKNRHTKIDTMQQSEMQAARRPLDAGRINRRFIAALVNTMQHMYTAKRADSQIALHNA